MSFSARATMSNMVASIMTYGAQCIPEIGPGARALRRLEAKTDGRRSASHRCVITEMLHQAKDIEPHRRSARRHLPRHRHQPGAPGPVKRQTPSSVFFFFQAEDGI